VTGGTYSGAPGAFFLQTVLWPTEIARNASIGCCASPSPAMPMPKVSTRDQRFSSRHNPKGRVYVMRSVSRTPERRLNFRLLAQDSTAAQDEM
jgi:hypothetical protein